jgi:hypothetical protein
MHSLRGLALALGTILALSAPAMAQRGGGFGMGGGGAMLLGNKSVQQELKLDAAQVEKANKYAEELMAKRREQFQGFQDLSQEERQAKMQELQKAAAEDTQRIVKELLKPEQAQRFRQIELQARGLMAFADAEVQKKLGLNDDQKQQIRDLAQSFQTEARDIRQNNQGNFEEIRKQSSALQKSKMEKVNALLSADQKSTWKDITGEPFEIKYEPRPQGGR